MSLDTIYMIATSICIPICGYAYKSIYCKQLENERKLSRIDDEVKKTNLVLYRDFVSKEHLDKIKTHFDEKMELQKEFFKEKFKDLQELIEVKIKNSK